MPKESQGPHLWLNKRAGSWYVVWREGNEAKRLSTGTDDSRKAQQYLANFLEGMANPSPPTVLTVGKVLDGYLEDRKWKIRSYATQVYACNALRRHLGLAEVGILTSKSLEVYAQKRFQEGVMRTVQGQQVRKDLSAGTIAREVQTLRAAMKWAHGARWIEGTIPLKMPVKAPPSRVRWLTKEEASALRGACTRFHLELCVMIALTTAARVGAILELTWDRVHMDRGIIDFGKGHGNKNRAIVPIGENLRTMLEQASELRRSTHVVEWEGKPIASIKTAYNGAVDRAKLDSSVNIHTLRHTAATWMVQAGIPLAQVARMMGDSEKMVEKVYGHHAPGYLKNAVGALSF